MGFWIITILCIGYHQRDKFSQLLDKLLDALRLDLQRYRVNMNIVLYMQDVYHFLLDVCRNSIPTKMIRNCLS